MWVRKADAVWEGTLKEGKGTMKLSSGAYEGPYTWRSRFENDEGTNPEELVAAAHAGCFSMALSSELGKVGFTPDRISTTANAHFEKIEAGWRIVKMHLVTEASVPNIDDAAFQEAALKAKTNCPVSNMFGSHVEISVEAKLV